MTSAKCDSNAKNGAAPSSRSRRGALKDMPVEIGKRRDGFEVGSFIVRDQGEPEPQLGKPHGGRREIDAKQRVGEDVALDGRGGPVAGGAPERRQDVERS